jgi:hypothetical protein
MMPLAKTMKQKIELPPLESYQQEAVDFIWANWFSNKEKKYPAYALLASGWVKQEWRVKYCQDY